MNRLFSTVATVRHLIAFPKQPYQARSTVAASFCPANVKSDQVRHYSVFRSSDLLTELQNYAEKPQNKVILGKIEAEVGRIWGELPQLKQSTQFYQDHSAGYLGRQEEQQKTHNFYEELYKTTLRNGVQACHDAIALIDRRGMYSADVARRREDFASNLECFQTELRIATEKYEEFLSRKAELGEDSYYSMIQRQKARAQKLPASETVQVPVHESIQNFHFY